MIHSIILCADLDIPKIYQEINGEAINGEIKETLLQLEYMNNIEQTIENKKNIIKFFKCPKLLNLLQKLHNIINTDTPDNYILHTEQIKTLQTKIYLQMIKQVFKNILINKNWDSKIMIGNFSIILYFLSNFNKFLLILYKKKQMPTVSNEALENIYNTSITNINDYNLIEIIDKIKRHLVLIDQNIFNQFLEKQKNKLLLNLQFHIPYWLYMNYAKFQEIWNQSEDK